jgi:N12 class adenine-specific DNA methylase/predicted RNA methylase
MEDMRAGSGATNGAGLCSLSLDDFEVPSLPTPVAQVAKALVAVLPVGPLLRAGEAIEGLDADEDGQIIDLSAIGESFVPEVPDEDAEFADRKVLWPQLDSADYRPSTADATRIEDNIAAIRLVKEIGARPRAMTAAEMTTLLRYSGWGGVARVFAPDGSAPGTYSKYRKQLEELVSEKELAAMRSSVNTAFYTPPEIAQAIWRIVEKLGFKGGRVLEPAAGTGQFFASMPHSLARKSSLTAVELEPVTASILEANFAPYGAQVQACGLENAKLPASFFDLCVSNVPFGDFKTNDTSNAPYADWSIHNWFLAKSIELVRPGGLVALITTRSSMDSKTDSHRKWLAAHAELIAAYRLPDMTFAQHAKTEAVTDLLVFKRRLVPDFSQTPVWVKAEEGKEVLFERGQSTTAYGYSRQNGRSYMMRAEINGYYNRQPEAMLGRLVWQSSQHGQIAVPQFKGSMGELVERLDELIERLPERVYVPAKAEATNPTAMVVRYNNFDGVLPGSFVVHQGRICISEGAELLDVDGLYNGTARKRLLGMLAIKEAAAAVINHQAHSDDDVQLASLQKHLNGVYDTFVAQLGPISTTANSRVMRGDTGWPLLLALEIWDDENQTATKADIFTKRTVGIPEIPQKVDNVKDAMLISLSVFGKIDLRDVALRWAKPVREVTDALREEALAFRDPVLGEWVPADEYLSGHIREKIDQAKAAGPAYEWNVPALEAVLPEDLGPAEVEARMGAPWIPCDVIETFCKELVDFTTQAHGSLTVTFAENTATWAVSTSHYHNRAWAGNRTKQTVEWGTDKRCALDLVEAALNQQPPTITMTVDEKQVVDRVATLAAREKWQAIRDKFRMWVYADDARRDRLLRLYNDIFNQVVPRKFDGSHLYLPGMSTAVTPYGHQKNGVWRIIVNGQALLAHCVGAGKTLTMVASSMELRRLGKARKPVHVVQNATLEQYAAEWVRLYPQARVLMATKDDLSGDKRRTFAARIATGDWDGVLMTQSTFERLNLSPGEQQGFIDALLAEARAMMNLADDSGAKRSIKEIEKRMKEYEAKIKRLAEAKADGDSVVWWDELGCDFLFYDEAHSLKNLGRLSKMPRIAGLPNVASQRAFDAFMKTRLIMRDRGNKEEGVVMSSATPISNSLAEMWVCQVFLQPYTLKRYGLYEFDAWSATFGEAVTGLELAPDGSGYRVNTRYARFLNLPELMSIFRGVADIQTKRMLNLPTPTIEGGKPQVIVSKPSDALKEIIKGLVERADKIRSGSVRPDEDNMLAVTNDGRKAALDVRMLLPELPADPDCKLVKVADNVVRIWKEGAERRVTQLVFSDLGTPGTPGFSVYAELRRLLIERGIPEAEVAFVHDYDTDSQRSTLRKRVNEGIVRVVLGSTSKLGTGWNVQKRLRGIHHIDCPWRPSDIEQRDGRGERQGNECEMIGLWRYCTEGSFDAYSWQLIEVKGRFIEQVMTSDKGVRTIEDVSLTALSYAEIKAIASGNPLVLEKATIDAKVQKLAFSYSQWEEDRWRLGHRKGHLSSRITWIEQIMPAIEQDAARAANLGSESTLSPVSAIAKAAAAQGGSTAEAIGLAFRSMTSNNVCAVLGEISGFRLLVERDWKSWALVLHAPNSGLKATVDRPNMNDVVGVGQAALDALKSVAGDPERLRVEHASKCEELASVDVLLAQEFDKKDELAAARARQAEIEAQLDLDKDTAGTADMSAEVA